MQRYRLNNFLEQLSQATKSRLATEYPVTPYYVVVESAGSVALTVAALSVERAKLSVESPRFLGRKRRFLKGDDIFCHAFPIGAL